MRSDLGVKGSGHNFDMHLAALFTVTILVKADCLHVVMLTPDVRDSAATLITVGTTQRLGTENKVTTS